MDKLIDEVKISGDDVMVDPDVYKGFMKALVHVFRNSLDHGIEYVYEREDCGKDKVGRIDCAVSRLGDEIKICILDDGRGIDFAKVKRIAVDKGLYSEKTIEAMDDNELSKLIFMSDFSTREAVSELSGRGFGLAAVMEEVNKLRGRIEVDSEAGKGTTFKFFIQYMG
ncbi:MAG: ATP-binding protein [Caulobacteraceae bacterium]